MFTLDIPIVTTRVQREILAMEQHQLLWFRIEPQTIGNKARGQIHGPLCIVALLAVINSAGDIDVNLA